MTPIPIWLGHGASGTAASMRPHVAGLRARGVEAHAVDLPRGSGERAVPAFRAAMLAQPPGYDAGDETARLASLAAGGHSFGGRVASMLAAETPLKALVLFSYPLHRPGFRDQLRTAHWPRLRCPMLFLSGDRDPFATIGLLREQVATLANAELVVYPGLGHGLAPVLDDALDRVAAFLQSLA
jgi:predicted alpha/beta-hydrolase family hydrolase